MTVWIAKFERLTAGSFRSVPSNSTVLVITGVVFDVQYAWAGDRIGTFLARRPLWQRLQRWLFASLLIGFSLRLAVGERPV